MRKESPFCIECKRQMSPEAFAELKQKMLNTAKRWADNADPSWFEEENEFKAYADQSGWHDSHDDSSSTTCWVTFYKAPAIIENWESNCVDRYNIMDNLPCKRSAAFLDRSYSDKWRDCILYYLEEPYGLQGVWILKVRRYKD